MTTNDQAGSIEKLLDAAEAASEWATHTFKGAVTEYKDEARLAVAVQALEAATKAVEQAKGAAGVNGDMYRIWSRLYGTKQ